MRVYDLAQAQWDSPAGCADLVEHFEHSTYKAEAERIVADMLRQLPHGTVIDLGCGPGRYVTALDTLYTRYTGYDTSLPLLAVARAGNAERKNVEFRLWDIADGADYDAGGMPDVLLSIDTSRHYHAPLALLDRILAGWPARTYVFSILHGPDRAELINGQVTATADLERWQAALGRKTDYIDQPIEGGWSVRYLVIR